LSIRGWKTLKPRLKTLGNSFLDSVAPDGCDGFGIDRRQVGQGAEGLWHASCSSSIFRQASRQAAVNSKQSTRVSVEIQIREQILDPCLLLASGFWAVRL
jgi:hypothetical protein